jgi:hypothetical protein
MSTPEDPQDPAITTRDDLARALAEKFLSNADKGNNEDNDDIVHELGKWRRKRHEH